MRPHTASASERKNEQMDSFHRPKTVSNSRSPGRSSRKSKRSKILEGNSVYSVIPDYSKSLSKTTTQLADINIRIDNLKDEKSTILDLIKRIKLGNFG